MKLSNKFWIWVSQVFALIILIFRAESLLELLKLIPNVDLTQLYPEIAGLALVVGFWGLWLVWSGIKGFSGEMIFLSDTHDRRW